tara:strand:+ start:88 stop:378 length:291 start_codon:yes stop_codon:yes gene_type:complete
VHIKTKKTFKELISKLTNEVLDEITTTDNVDTYLTPYAFTGRKNKKRRKKISTGSTGYNMVKEELNDKDLKNIRKLIRDVVANILRDIWLKRTTWK